MVPGEIFTAIDIGSSKIKTIIGTFTEDKRLRVLGVGLAASRGVRKGNILDMEEFTRNVDASLLEAEKMTGEEIRHVHLCVSGTSIESVVGTGSISVPQGEVTDDDVARALDLAQNTVGLSNREVLKVIPESYSLDNEGGIKNPVGMAAKRLEVRAHIFSVGENVLGNIKKGIADVGVDIYDVYPNVIAAPEAVLSRRQKELGVVVVDIGASTTDVAVYEEGALIFATVIPLGGEHVTSDVAIGARVSIDLAEKLKVEYGDLAFTKDEKAKDEEIQLSKLSKTETATVSKKYLSDIVRARYSEIFYFINAELKKIGRDGMLPEGAVLTGGGSKMRGVVDLAKEIFRLPATVGIPEDSDLISGTSIGDPVYAGVIGTLLLSQKYGSGRGRLRLSFSVGGFANSLKNIFSKLVP